LDTGSLCGTSGVSKQKLKRYQKKFKKRSKKIKKIKKKLNHQIMACVGET
jgi:hypothetical protein